jgi:L-seryl-tRNA(Ser) seleniumtransferase
LKIWSRRSSIFNLKSSIDRLLTSRQWLGKCQNDARQKPLLQRRRAMALKPAELWNQLPSVAELLEKPPIRALANRWNRSVVAGSVRSFLEEMRSELRRRAGELPLPSVRELAERAARYVVCQQQLSLGTAINATGRLGGAPWSSRPISEAALERMWAVGREFGLDTCSSVGAGRADFEPMLCRLAGAEAAVAVNSYAGALSLLLSAIAAQREALVARAEIGDVDSSEPLTRLAAGANVSLREVGTINRATAADYEAGASPQAAALLRIAPDTYRVVGDTTMAELEELVPLCRDRDLLLVDAVGFGPLVDPPESMRWPLRSVQASLAAGVDVAVVRGDGLVGGPGCGLVLGRRDAIRRVTDHPLYAAMRLDAMRSAALVATLESYETKSAGHEQPPVWQLLTASVENLCNRSERMAAQLAHATGIASATAVETRSGLFSVLTDGCPSYGVALAPADGDIGSFDRRLRSLSVPIVGRVEGDRLILDLRTVLPRQDPMLVESLLGPPAVDERAAVQCVGPLSEPPEAPGDTTVNF